MAKDETSLPQEPSEKKPAAATGAKKTRLGKAGSVLATAFVPKSLPMAAKQFRTSAGNVKEAIDAARKVQARRRAETALPIKSVFVRDGDQVREIRMPADPSERFELLYDVYGWDEAMRKSQIRAAHRAKLSAMVMTVVAFCLALFMLSTTSMRWLAVLMVPMSLMVLAVGLAMVFRWALIEFQYTRRSLVNYRTFLAQKDFFRWIFS